MHFGTMSAPRSYTNMMQNFHGKWNIFFIITVCGMDEIGRQKVVVTEIYNILVGGIKVYSDSKGIIDDIII